MLSQGWGRPAKDSRGCGTHGNTAHATAQSQAAPRWYCHSRHRPGLQGCAQEGPETYMPGWLAVRQLKRVLVMRLCWAGPASYPSLSSTYMCPQLRKRVGEHCSRWIMMICSPQLRRPALTSCSVRVPPHAAPSALPHPSWSHQTPTSGSCAVRSVERWQLPFLST